MALIPGITFDTGALIALERRDKRMRARFLAAEQDGHVITVPAVVLGEWWRGDPRQREILEGVDVEDVSEQLGKLAGEAIAALPGATVVDAIVMASAAQRGDVVYTSDFKDLERLRAHFLGVYKVLHV